MHSLEKKFLENPRSLTRKELYKLINFLKEEKDFVFELNNKLVNDFREFAKRYQTNSKYESKQKPKLSKFEQGLYPGD